MYNVYVQNITLQKSGITQYPASHSFKKVDSLSQVFLYKQPKAKVYFFLVYEICRFIFSFNL